MTHFPPPPTRTRPRALRALGLVLALLLAAATPVLAGRAPVPAFADATEGPMILSFEPQSGPAGTYVTIQGTGFSPYDTLLLGGVEQPMDWYGEERVGFEVPDLVPASYELSLQGSPGASQACCFEVTDADADDEDDAGDDGDSGDVGGGKNGGSSSGCSEPEYNVQCTEFGSIRMDSQRDIRGERIDLTAWIYLNTAYEDRNARWLMFSVRNVTSDGTSPVTLEVVRFGTEHGDIVTSRVEQPTPNEVNLWVDVLDTPVGTPITIDMKVGSTERGAFRVETLVLAFDRGYAPMQTASGDASLFSFTLLGVNEETSGASGAGQVSLFDGHKVPGLASLTILVAIGGVAAFLRRRRQ